MKQYFVFEIIKNFEINNCIVNRIIIDYTRTGTCSFLRYFWRYFAS